MFTGLSARDVGWLSPTSPIASHQREESNSYLGRKVAGNGADDVSGQNPPSASKDGSETPHPRSPTQTHQRLVFSDPVAFRYLEDDPGTMVLERRGELQGYELYIVEQWVCSRTAPTFIICSYTGDMSRFIQVSVLSVPVDESSWSSRLKTYFQAIDQSYARKRETPLGTLMVMNLSSFPSSLTVIPVPDGNARKHREDFMVNLNLKRMGCSGRAGMNLQYPQANTIAKFHHVYRTSENVPLYFSVLELVKLCQTALHIFGKLQMAYVDGLLCDKSEKAINDWWADIGTFFYNIEPTDGILGPSTVASLLGLMCGAYNRLNVSGMPVGKDVLDTTSTKQAISTFQKLNRLPPSRRLDRQTLDKLHRSTAKSASGEKWTVPKAVKSTVAELGGKGGEMVMGIVGGRDKAGIAEIETFDLDRFAQLVTSPRMKWLWQGKRAKSSTFTDHSASIFDELNGRIFSSDDQGNFMWTSPRRDSVSERLKMRRTDSSHTQADGDSRSGIGRIKDAVGLPSARPQIPRQITERPEEAVSTRETGSPTSQQQLKEQRQSTDHRLRHSGHEMDPAAEKFPLEAESLISPVKSRLNRQTSSLRSVPRSSEELTAHREQLRKAQLPQTTEISRSKSQRGLDKLRKEFKAEKYQNFSSEFRYDGPQATRLRRSRSAVQLVDVPFDFARSARIPRRLSFTAVESAVLGYADATTEANADDDKNISNDILAQELALTAAQMHAKKIMHIEQAFMPYADTLVDNVESLEREAAEHLEELNSLYYQRLDEYQSLQTTSTDVVVDEKARLTDSVRRLEMLGAKLDYELTALNSRIQEVEDSVTDFERSVLDLEAKGRDLTVEDRNRRSSWFFEIMQFFGSGRSYRGPRGGVSR